MKKLVILIPAFNEARTISSVIEKLPKTLPGFSAIDVIVVDDGSTDETVTRAREAGARIISHGRNRGVGAALGTGITAALQNGADVLVSMDADGQFDSADIPQIITPIMAGEADMVVGNRFATNERPEHMPSTKYMGNIIMSWIVSMLIGKTFRDVSCGFRAYGREALLNMHLFGNFTYTQEMFIDMREKGMRITDVPVSVRYFPDRKSKVAGNLITYGFRAFGIIFRAHAFHRPMRFFGYPAIASLLLGFIFVGFLVVYRVSVGSFTPYKAFGFIGGGFMIFGILLLFLAIVVDIIDKMRTVNERVLYFEKKRMYGDSQKS